MKRVLSLLCLLTLLASCSLGRTESVLRHPDQPIVVGVLLGGGGMASLSDENEEAIRKAEADILRELNPNIEVIYKRTEGDPNLALKELNELNNQGVSYVVGPFTSNEVAYVSNSAAQSNTVLISPSSTAPFLASANNTLFRLVPDDRLQAKYLAASLLKDGVKDLIIVARSDVYGQQLSSLASSAFTSGGGNKVEPLYYPLQMKYGETNLWPELIRDLRSAIDESAGEGKVGILAIGFDELTEFFSLLAKENLHDSVVIYGSEMLAKNSAIKSDDRLAQFLLDSGARFALFETERSIEIEKGAGPLSGLRFEALAAYDALWLAVLASYHHSSPSSLRDASRAVRSAARAFSGMTGDLKLNEHGDRSEGSFKSWSLRLNEMGEFEWYRASSTL